MVVEVGVVVELDGDAEVDVVGFAVGWHLQDRLPPAATSTSRERARPRVRPRLRLRLSDALQ